MQLVDNVCYDYRGRLSIIEALKMPIGDLMLLYKFISDRREAADAVAKKEKDEKDKQVKYKYLQAAYRGHPQANIENLDGSIDTTRIEDARPAMTREDYARFEDALEEMV